MDMLDDRWDSRDFPTLREAVRMWDTATVRIGVRVMEIAPATGLSEDDTLLALRALAEDNLIELDEMEPPRATRVIGITGEARRRVGLWPTPETGVERMIAALEALANNASDEDTRSRARKILEGFGGAGKQIAIATATAVVTGQLPN